MLPNLGNVKTHGDASLLTPEFESLLSMPESAWLDFKRDAYDFSADEENRKRARFVKDVISMFNTPRDRDAFIVLGVDKRPGERPSLLGIATHLDDADLQSKFEGLIHPHPIFRCVEIEHSGNRFSVIHIPVDRSRGPCVPVRDMSGVLERHRVYVRHNSQNAVADAEEQRRVYRWFQDTPFPPAEVLTDDANWGALVEGLRGFDPSYNYVLVTPRLEHTEDRCIGNLGLVDWSLVIDFDPRSDVDGLFSACRDVVASRRAVHLVTRGQRIQMNPRGGTYWYLARGQIGREALLSLGPYKDWITSYGDDLRQQLHELARRGATRPFSILALCHDADLVRHFASVFDACAACFGNSAHYVVTTDLDPSEFIALQRDYEAAVISISTSHVCHGLRSLPNLGQAQLPNSVPSSSGAPVAIGSELLGQLTEDLEIVHLGIGHKRPSDREPERDFLRGHEISWHDLGLRADVERDVTAKMERVVRQDLEARTASRVNLYHAAGAGGTTLAKRVLWDLHRQYPCVLLRRCVPEETVERLAQIASMAGSSVLVAVEGHLVTETEVEHLYQMVRSRHLPVVILQVVRRSQAQRAQGLKQRTFYLQEALSPEEATAFGHYLKRASPTRSAAIETALASTSDRDRTPFYLGLVAFERDFVGIERYVDAHLGQLTPTQSRVVALCALAYYYAQQAVPAQMFAPVLGLPGARVLDLRRALPEQAFDLLIEDDPGSWRPSHQLLAEAMVVMLLTPQGADPRVWKQSLSGFARAFIDFCRDASPSLSEEAFEILRRVFVLRDSREDLGTERASSSSFSQIIDDIPNDSGRLEILRYLTERVPDEPHFWAHLGRFLSYRLRDFDEAFDAIRRGLQLAPTDHVLYHMLGMAQRGKVYRLMDTGGPIGEIVDAACESAASFSRARELAPDDEHGYISEVQLITRVLDHAAATHGTSQVEVVCATTSSPWLRESIQRVEDLLAQVRSNRGGDSASEYEERCRADLANVYGQHEVALQRFQNLLDRRQVHAPPMRRQIVWTYLARRGRNWAQVPEAEILRIVRLLEQNMEEESGDQRNLRLWMRAIRRLASPPSLDRVLEQVGYWNANTNSLESSYYLYVLNNLRALDGLALARDQADRALTACREKSSYLRNRTRSFEWLGRGVSIQRLVHQDELGAWSSDAKFYLNVAPLNRIEGIVSRIERPEKGEIELPGSVRAFFVPGHSQHVRGRDENRRITCFLGFSYDGPRAWSVQNA